MEEYEQDIDPIYGNRIENPFVLGKTRYSLFSLYDWFLVRKCFINPMTNNLLSQNEQSEIIDRFVEKNLLPTSNYSKMTSYKIVLMMEKHKVYLDEIKKNNDKLANLQKKLEVNEIKLMKARKKEIYEEIIKKIKGKIEVQEKILQNLKVI